MSGSAKIYEAVFAFDSSWDGFARTAVFECAGERREQLLVNDRCIVPWEILHAGAYLRVGVYGVDGNKTMPTVYSSQMFVARGAEPSETAREHSPDVFDQIVEIGDKAAEDAESAANSAGAAAASADSAIEALKAFHAPTATAQTLQPGTPATASYDGQNFTFGIPKGAKGDAGPAGSDANVTAENIKSALGYTPADDDDLTELEDTKVGYSEVVGNQLLMYSDSTKEHLLATLDLPTPDLTDYVKNTDYATGSVAGVIKSGNGFVVTGSGISICGQKTAEQYKNTIAGYFIAKGTLDSVLATPSIMPELTENEQAAARERIGLETIINGKQDKLIAGDNITIAEDGKTISAAGGNQLYFAITEDMVTVTLDPTKGVAPYSTSYGMTYIEINKDADIKWVEGGLYTFVVDTKMVVQSTYRNVAVRIGGEDDGDVWHPLFATTAVISGSSFLIKAMNTTFQYKSVYRPEGALHVQTDSNTTYAYLVNTMIGDANGSIIHIDPKGYGAKYALTFPTTPLSDENGIVTDELWSSLVASSSTGSTKKAVKPTSGKFYADRQPVYIYSANVNAGAKAVNAVYQDYAGFNPCYTANTASNWISPYKRLFLYLHNYNPADKSFEADVTAGNVMTIDKISARFPATTEGSVYLYWIGYTQAAYSSAVPEFAHTSRIWKYTPSTGKLEIVE